MLIQDTVWNLTYRLILFLGTNRSHFSIQGWFCLFYVQFICCFAEGTCELSFFFDELPTQKLININLDIHLKHFPAQTQSIRHKFFVIIVFDSGVEIEDLCEEKGGEFDDYIVEDLKEDMGVVFLEEVLLNPLGLYLRLCDRVHSHQVLLQYLCVVLEIVEAHHKLSLPKDLFNRQLLVICFGWLDFLNYFLFECFN